MRINGTCGRPLQTSASPPSPDKSQPPHPAVILRNEVTKDLRLLFLPFATGLHRHAMRVDGTCGRPLQTSASPPSPDRSQPPHPAVILRNEVTKDLRLPFLPFATGLHRHAMRVDGTCGRPLQTSASPPSPDKSQPPHPAVILRNKVTKDLRLLQESMRSRARE